MDIDFKKELDEMRVAYIQKPPKFELLPKPYWMSPQDELYSIYSDKKTLFKYGKIYYAALVQANSLLFDAWSFDDCPANFIYSTSAQTEKDPYILADIAHTLYAYKDKTQEEIPPAFREIVAVIADEHDRSGFGFTLSNEEGQSLDVNFVAAMVFRKHLPGRVLKCGIFPIIAAPEHCASVMVLPKRYWTKGLTEAWKKQLL